MNGREQLVRPTPDCDFDRLNATKMVPIQGFGYLGQVLSSAEILAVLFGGGFVRAGRDRFVLSPGHYVIALYAVAAELGLLSTDELASYSKEGALLEAIGTVRTPLVDLVCGSLGQGCRERSVLP